MKEELLKRILIGLGTFLIVMISIFGLQFYFFEKQQKKNQTQTLLEMQEKLKEEIANSSVVSSDNDDIVEIREDGKIIVKDKGTANITIQKDGKTEQIRVESKDGKTITNITTQPSEPNDFQHESNDRQDTDSKSDNISVPQPPSDITQTPGPSSNLVFSTKMIQMNVGEQKINAPVLTGLSPNNITWKSNNPTVVEVTQNGTIRAKKHGTAVITAQVNNIKDSYTVTVYANYETLSLYISPTGNDQNDGLSNRSPVKTLERIDTLLQDYTNDSNITFKNVHIHIAPGKYVGQTCIFNFGNGNKITFSGDENNKPIFIGNATNTDTFLDIIDNKNSTYIIENIVVQRYYNGIRLKGDYSKKIESQNNRIYNIDFKNMGNDYTGTKEDRSYFSLEFYYSSNNVVRNCTFTNISDEGSLHHAIYFYLYSNNNKIYNNTFTNTKGDPIRIRYGSSNNEIYINTFNNTGTRAFCSVNDRDSVPNEAEPHSTGNIFRYNTLNGGGYRGDSNILPIKIINHLTGVDETRIKEFGNTKNYK